MTDEERNGGNTVQSRDDTRITIEVFDYDYTNAAGDEPPADEDRRVTDDELCASADGAPRITLPVKDSDLTSGTILLSENERHVLCRRVVRGIPAPRGLLVSVPRDGEPNAVSVIRSVDIAVLRVAINCGAIRILELGMPPAASARNDTTIADLMLTGALFSASRLIPRIDPFDDEDSES